MGKSSDLPGLEARLQREELDFWECQSRCGDDADLKMARDLPEDTPDFILKMMAEFEEEAARFCFSGASGVVLDAGCGNGNLLLRALCKGEGDAGQRDAPDAAKATAKARAAPGGFRAVGMDFSKNMLKRAAVRAEGLDRSGGGQVAVRPAPTAAGFLQGSVTALPFRDQSFDRVVSSGVLTCLPNSAAALFALQEFYRVLKPGGVLVVDFFSRISHYTLLRKHLFRERISPPEYVSPAEFRAWLEDSGFAVLCHRGFDFKLFQGYLFMSRWRPLVDPAFVQERVSRFLERRVLPGRPGLNLLGYRIYVKCLKK
ncbi:MAG TPA: class I SAM-dependent methyltransferase [Methanothrix sp.]|nr:class I SAM-dependent methyltransferase [Methanothrix sp.]HPT19329.1 class I SAM-dependent methyltransferase [Methanothrix sp.]